MTAKCPPHDWEVIFDDGSEVTELCKGCWNVRGPLIDTTRPDISRVHDCLRRTARRTACATTA
jgi:hypothetical protein